MAELLFTTDFNEHFKVTLPKLKRLKPNQQDEAFTHFTQQVASQLQQLYGDSVSELGHEVSYLGKDSGTIRIIRD